MKRMTPFLLAACFLSGLAVPAFAIRSAVDLKNDVAMAVSVPLGTDSGVTRNNDFLVSADNGAVTIYPQELFAGRFWSQPLSEEDYARVRTGMEVRPVTLDNVTHAVARAKGDVRQAEILARQEEARRQFMRRKIEEHKETREKLLDRRDGLDERIAAAENALADEEGRMDWLMNSEDDRIERALKAIQDLADRRDELQAQREALAQSSSRGDVARQSAEIKRLNDRIGSERDNIRSARDRKGAARTAYMSRKQEWQKLAADRNLLRNEILSIDRKIKDLAGQE
jgi:flagellar biosynthesis GTPase FlhF